MLLRERISFFLSKTGLIHFSIITFTIFTFSLLINTDNLGEVNAQINTTNTLAQFNPGQVIAQPPLDANTGQVIKLPGSVVGIKDPQTGQIEVQDIRLQPPIVKGGSITSSTSDVNSALGLSSSLVNPTTDKFGSGLTAAAAIGLSSVLSSNTVVTTSAPGPTYNPPLKKCDTGTAGPTVTTGGFDIAKYIVTGKLNKDKIKGDKFSFNIFSDLVKNDGAEIKGQDAPYKANYATKDGDKIADINLDEIATICIDTAKIVNVAEITDIDLDDSALFESLNYE
jgi:hypothetical protein